MNVPETFFSVREELVLFGLSCLAGVFLGLFYDVFRVMRMILPHNTLLVVFEDVLFMGCWAVFLSAFASAAARGEMRFYYFAGNVIGFALYFFTLGVFVIRTLHRVFTAVGRALYFIFTPLRKIFVLLRAEAGAKFVGSSKVLVNTIKKAQLLLPKSKFLLYNEMENKKRKNVKNVAKKSKR